MAWPTKNGPIIETTATTIADTITPKYSGHSAEALRMMRKREDTKNSRFHKGLLISQGAELTIVPLSGKICCAAVSGYSFRLP